MCYRDKIFATYVHAYHIWLLHKIPNMMFDSQHSYYEHACKSTRAHDS